MSVAIEPSQERIIEQTLSKVSGVATLPSVTARIVAIVEDPKSQAADLHAVIKTDPVLATKVLKAVNSAFYGLPSQVSSIERAIVLLGLSTVQNLAIASSITRMFRDGKVSEHFEAEDLWKHCVAVAVAARCLARSKGEAEKAEEAFVTGLIHDLGILVELQAFGEKFKEVIERAVAKEDTFLNCERQVFGIDHALLGGALAQRWKFPASLVACVRFHHASSEAPQELRPRVALLEVADIVACRQEFGLSLTVSGAELNPSLLQKASLEQAHIDNLQSSLTQDCEAAMAMLTG